MCRETSTNPDQPVRSQRMTEAMTKLTRPGDELLHFAPNFTAYALPPDMVCLYSEDRKFFLHGELYCALAAAIGDGGKNLQKLIRELEQKFP